MATYSISKDPTATNLTISKNSSNQINITKNPGFTKAYFTKSGGAEVSIGKNSDSYSIITDGKILLETGDALLLEQAPGTDALLLE